MGIPLSTSVYYFAFAFQRGKSEGVNAVFHFTFRGGEEIKATIVIRDKKLQIREGHSETPDLRVIADSKTWLSFLREGDQHRLGIGPPEDPHSRLTSPAARLWSLLSILSSGRRFRGCYATHADGTA